MTKQELLSRYMETFADKTLSFWCQIYIEANQEIDYIISYGKHSYQLQKNYTKNIYNGNWWDTEPFKIIWHPLTWGQLKQLMFEAYTKEYPTNQKYYIMDKLEKELINKNMLDKTIYERVEDSEVLDILIDIKKEYEIKNN